MRTHITLILLVLLVGCNTPEPLSYKEPKATCHVIREKNAPLMAKKCVKLPHSENYYVETLVGSGLEVHKSRVRFLFGEARRVQLEEALTKPYKE